VGLDDQRNVVFDFAYETTFCVTAWNAIPIDFDEMTIR
jgi:hypothetical protein